MTPSAARGILEAVLWKPAIKWHIHRIHVLNQIRFVAFRRNEVNSRAPAPPLSVVEGGGRIAPFYADEDRAQRNTIALREVDYLIEARFEMTDRSGPADNIQKFVEMFERRIEKGQHYHQPYLGCREFPAEVEAPENAPPPINETRDLGLMLWDILFNETGNRALFFEAKLDAGVLNVPDAAAVMEGQ